MSAVSGVALTSCSGSSSTQTATSTTAAPAGPTIVLSYSGRATKQGEDTTISGELEAFGGSGRYSTVTGSGTVSGERRADLGGDVDYRFTLTLAGLPR